MDGLTTRIRLGFVNAYLLEAKGGFILVDTGMKKCLPGLRAIGSLGAWKCLFEKEMAECPEPMSSYKVGNFGSMGIWFLLVPDPAPFLFIR
jgi:hypothetical protein